MAQCENCDREATRESIMGRQLCHDCYANIVGAAGGGSAVAGGGGLGKALTTGFGSRGYAGATLDEAGAERKRREKLAATRGFWRRLWVRIVG